MLHKHLAILGQLDPDRAQPETGGPRPEQVAAHLRPAGPGAPFAERFEQVWRRVVIGSLRGKLCDPVEVQASRFSL